LHCAHQLNQLVAFFCCFLHFVFEILGPGHSVRDFVRASLLLLSAEGASWSVA
jgi:hypothetical protein